MLINKVIIKGKLKLLAPLLIGSGVSDNTDIDILSDKKGQPYIPATSFIGILRHTLKKEYKLASKEFDTFWGTEKESKSQISCDDLMLVSNKGKAIRDGIRIDSKTGIVANGAKYDFETVNKNSEFGMRLEVDFSDNDAFAKKLLNTIISLLKEELHLGAKTRVGFGKAKVVNLETIHYDFSKKEHATAWLYNQPTHTEYKIAGEKFEKQNSDFVIDATFEIKNSLIVRSYSKEADAPDSTSLKSGDDYILPGTSLKGALRARIERILNTLYPEKGKKNQEIIDCFLGGVERTINEKGEEIEKADGYKIPSRFLVEETNISDVVAELQNRIKIDRFTGGTINSALFDSVPLFPEGVENLKNLKITIKNAASYEKGLALLILKDLWTGDLALGGEKNVGRGVLKGHGATICDGDKTFSFKNLDQLSKEQKELMQNYVNALNSEYHKYSDNADKNIKRYLEV